MRGTDEQFMRRAIELARRGVGLTSPNPAVGALLVRNGRVVGEGFFLYEHFKHAEVYALEAAGDRARGATLYCSLEPCCFQGRTPPCTDALIEAGIARAVIAVADPHPRVRGRGLEQLRYAGIAVEVGLLEGEAKRLNEAFFKFALEGLPLIHVVKVEEDERVWTPSVSFLETAMEYDAILLESLSEAANVLPVCLERHRHRPLIIAGARSVLQRAGAMFPAINDRQKTAAIELEVTTGAGVSNPRGMVEKMLAPLVELRAESLLVLMASPTASPLYPAADKLTRVVGAEGAEGQKQAIASKMKGVVINESAGFKEITGYPRPRGEESD